ncbi:Uncharacterised protein [Staphylococcus aureus]|nr:Uncharacterised protein [Staphylococcus aureus]
MIACAEALVKYQILIIWALNALGANLTAALLPVGDKHSSPITQIMYDKITQLTEKFDEPDA